MDEGDARGETRGLREAGAGDALEGRTSKDASPAGGWRGAGDRGERGGDGAAGWECLRRSWSFTFAAALCCFSPDLGEP